MSTVYAWEFVFAGIFGICCLVLLFEAAFHTVEIRHARESGNNAMEEEAARKRRPFLRYAALCAGIALILSLTPAAQALGFLH